MGMMKSMRPGIWNRSHHLDRMNFRQLVVAYFQYPAIIAYLLLSAVAIGVFAFFPAPLLPTLAAIGVSALAYPLVWYVLHRFVLHSRWMFKMSPLAATWKRIHYDHHQDPNHLEVLFGALHTTLPAVAAVTLPIGYLIGGIGGAAIALATGLLFLALALHSAGRPDEALRVAIEAVEPTLPRYHRSVKAYAAALTEQ